MNKGMSHIPTKLEIFLYNLPKKIKAFKARLYSLFLKYFQREEWKRQEEIKQRRKEHWEECTHSAFGEVFKKFGEEVEKQISKWSVKNENDRKI